MNPLVVLAPDDVAAGFALGGARVRSVAANDPVATAVDAAVTETDVVFVHHLLWLRARDADRRRWQERTDRLVLALPPDDGEPTVDHAAELHELLARAVGYEISFTSGGQP